MVDNERWLASHTMQIMHLLNLSVNLIRQFRGRQSGSLSTTSIAAFPAEVDCENRQVVLSGKVGSFSIISAMTDVEDKMDPVPPLYSEESRGETTGDQAVTLNEIERIHNNRFRIFPGGVEQWAVCRDTDKDAPRHFLVETMRKRAARVGRVWKYDRRD